MLQISRQFIKACASYQKVERRFEGTYLRNGWVDLAQIQRFPPQREFAQKNLCASVQGSVELQMHENGIFFTAVKYTLVCCTPLVSWAA